MIKNQDFGSKVSAIIDGKDDSIGTVEGYDYKTDELVMTQVSKDVVVEEGDAVITSGLGWSLSSSSFNWICESN